jgi:hypothetical protein
LICKRAVWFCCGLFYWGAAYQGVFTPSDPLIFQNTEYKDCRPVNDKDSFDFSLINNRNHEGKTKNWYTCGKLKGEYSTFSPLTYSLDVILPLIDLGQEKTWGTYIDTPKENAICEFLSFTINHVIRLIIWIETLFGWMASLMLVAFLTGLSDRYKY